MTTPIPTTPAPTTSDPAELPVIACARRHVPARNEVVVRVWTEDAERSLLVDELSMDESGVELVSETGQRWAAKSEFEDPAGRHVLLFRMPQVQLMPGHAYFLRVSVVRSDGYYCGTADFAMGTT